MPDPIPPASPPGPAPSFAIDDNTGDVYSVKPGHETEAVIKGLRPVDANEANSFLVQKKYGTAQQQLLGVPEAFASGVTGGLSEVAEKALGVNPEAIKGRAEANPVSHTISEGLGIGAGFEALGGLGELLGLEGGTVGANLAKGALQQGLWGGAREYSDQILNDQSFNGEAIMEQAGIQGLLGAGAEAGLFGLGRAIKTKLPSLTAQADGLASNLFTKASSLVNGESVDTIKTLLGKVKQAVESGTEVSPLLDKEAIDQAKQAAELLTNMRDEVKSSAGDIREQLYGDLKAKFSGDGSAQKQAATQMLDSMQARIEDFKANNPRTTTLGESGFKLPSRAEFEQTLADQTGVSLERLQQQPDWQNNVDQAYESATQEALKSGKIGTNVLGDIDVARKALSKASTAEDVWHAMHDFKSNLETSARYGEREFKGDERPAIEMVREFAQNARSFTKSEDLYPEFGGKWAMQQEAHSDALRAFGNLEDAAKRVEGGEYIPIHKDRLVNLLKHIVKDREHFGAKVLDDAVEATRNLGKAHDELGPLLKPDTHVPIIPKITAQAEKLEAARRGALRSLELKEAAGRLGGASSVLGRGVFRPGFEAFIASRVLGIPYAAAALPIVGYKALAQPLVPAMAAARLAGVVGKLTAKINTGAAKSVARLLAGTVKAGAVGETLSQLSRQHVQTDLLTNKLYKDWQQGAQAHADFIQSPGDFSGKVTDSLGQLDGDNRQMAAMALGNHIGYLQSVAPKSTNIGTAEPVSPSKPELARFAKISYAVSHPVETLNEQLAAGVPDPEVWNAIEATSPGIMSRYRIAMTRELSKAWSGGEKLALRAQRGFARANGGDLESGLMGLKLHVLTNPPNLAQPLPNLGTRPNKSIMHLGQSSRLPYQRQSG